MLIRSNSFMGREVKLFDAKGEQCLRCVWLDTDKQEAGLLREPDRATATKPRAKGLVWARRVPGYVPDPRTDFDTFVVDVVNVNGWYYTYRGKTYVFGNPRMTSLS